MYQAHKVSLVFPAYNEEEGIGSAIDDFRHTNIIDEVIVVDNNSKDKTAEIARLKGAKVVHEKKQGYGHALLRGLKEATSDLIILCEPDGTFSSKDLKRLLIHSRTFDVVLGSRTHKKYIEKGANMKPLLRLGNFTVAKLLQTLYLTSHLSDCGCTFRIFKKEVGKMIAQKATVGSSHFLPETVILSALHGYTMKEIPVTYRKRIGTSKITGSFKRTVQVGFGMLGLILQYKIKRPSA